MNQEENNKHMYTNFASLELGRFDFNFTFAHIIDEKTYDKIAVSMSPQHAKAFLHMLMYNVNQYEEAFGEINLDERVKTEN